jgi:hypothetical protein
MDSSHLIPTAKPQHHTEFDSRKKDEKEKAELKGDDRGESDTPFWVLNPAPKTTTASTNANGNGTSKMKAIPEVTKQNGAPNTVFAGRSKKKKSLVLCFDGTGTYI